MRAAKERKVLKKRLFKEFKETKRSAIKKWKAEGKVGPKPKLDWGGYWEKKQKDVK